jgi:hypothetical protein
MTSSARPFTDLVRFAHDGRLKLPAFQRKWRWKADKVIKLFDSLRKRYPIGALLFLKGENEALAPRLFDGCHTTASNAEAEYLVLDGQQRLTAGIHLFHATGLRQYFVSIDVLAKLVADQNVDLTNRQQIDKFVATLEAGDGYLVARASVADPRSLLIRKHLLCTSILADSTELSVAINDYVRAEPTRQDLMLRLVQPHFSLARTDSVPVIEIDGDTTIEAISNIFMTLNTTGQLLTPFELVVSLLYPREIDLSLEVADLKESGTYFPNMDKTGEVLLQTIAMLSGQSPKKSNLPTTITATIYQQHKKDAFNALERLGQFLTERLGAGLNIPNVDMVPYDATFAPMALALKEICGRSLRGPELIRAERKLSKWYVGGALSNRYQEGVHNKQTKDLKEFMLWLDDDAAQPPWLAEVTIPRLLRASTEGAVGKLIRGLFNRANPRDPATGNTIGFGPGTYNTEKHHIFPIKYLATIHGWQQNDSGDVILNLMFLQAETNKRWINNNPADHINEAEGLRGEVEVNEAYRLQLIDDNAFVLLKRPRKTKTDFEEFLVLRESAVQRKIESEFELPIAALSVQEEFTEIE